MEPVQTSVLATRARHELYDLAVVGAGPIGLAIAVEAARLGLDVLVVDRRTLADSALRPQILVARRADLASLARLGVDIWDTGVVAHLDVMVRVDGVTDVASETVISPLHDEPDPARSLHAFVGQSPAALVPIGALQRALLGALEAAQVASSAEVDVLLGARVLRVRRHVKAVSIELAGARPLRAKLAVIATGAARSLAQDQTDVDTLLYTPRCSPTRTLIGGVFDRTGELCRWLRAQVPVGTYPDPVRFTALDTGPDAGAGTALIVDAPASIEPTRRDLDRCFDVAAEHAGLSGAPFLVEPRPFGTGVQVVRKRTFAGDGRAPLVIAGDAAQTGHVYGGLTCFLNLALALGLCRGLARAAGDVKAGKLGSPALLEALDAYENASDLGASLLRETSRKHIEPQRDHAWSFL